MRFTPALLRRLVTLHKQAVAEGRESFAFQGGELDTRYAGYLLQFLGPKLIPENGRQR